MKLIHFTAQPNGLRLETSRGLIDLTAYSADIVRIRYTLEPVFSPKKSLMVMCEAQNPLDVFVQETSEALFFSTSRLSIQINRDTLAFTYRDSHGQILTCEPGRGGKTLMPVDVIKFIPNTENGIMTDVGADGLTTSASAFTEIVDRKAYHTKLEFEWADGEALYGLGSHEEGMFNLRGQHQYLYQQNMKSVVPVLVSTRGYGIILDSYSLMTFHDDAFGSYLWSDVDDELDYYFIYGPEFDQIVHEIRELTGHSPMLPKWAFGYVQSKERYATQDELISIVREYRRRELPLDCIVLDWKSWSGDLWGQKTLDPERFPNPSQMTADLHALNARLMVSIWPIMRPGGDNWQEMKDQGHLLGNQATYNAFSAEARACYWKQAEQGLFSHGFDAWWCDCTEPFEADWKGASEPEPEERLRINTEESKRYLDPEFINAYSLLHSQGIYEGQRRVTREKRVINLTRSAYLGQQRYATITWSGDTAASWETLRRQIADGLNFCATGMPYWTMDIGAFFVKHKPELWFWCGNYDEGVDDLGYRELFVRWFQYGAFLPMFRAHGTDTPREIWRFGNPGDPFFDALVNALRLRYRLLPYIYSLAGWTTQHDYTMLRALPFDFRSDPLTYAIRDQYMFGPALMVNPVTRPMLYNAGSQPLNGIPQTRPVYLPSGADWYDFWTGQRYAGGQTIKADAPISRLPLFVRAGSILPMGPVRQHVNDLPEAPIELHIYPGQDGSFELYEDEGDEYNYEDGAFSTIDIQWVDAERQLILEARKGEYAGMPDRRTFEIVLHDAKTFRHEDSKAGSNQTVIYYGRPVMVKF
jgi:alpha-D-xyloside xylohydrolase